MKDILFLDAVLSTKIITMVYWIMLIVILFMGIFIGSGSVPFGWAQDANEAGRIVIAILFIIVASIFARLWAEFMVVIFKIQQNTRRTAEALERRNGIL